MQGLVSRRKLAVGAIVLFFLLSLNMVSSQARGFALSVSSPFQVALWGAGGALSTFFGGGELRLENDALRQENRKLKSRIVELRAIERENKEFREVLKFGLSEEFELAPGEVIAKYIADDTIVIQGGSRGSIRKDMPVITAEKIAVGRVIKVFDSYALVQLLSAEKSSLDAQVAEKETVGLVRGKGRQKIVLDLVPQKEDLAAGDTVLTSSLGGAFPENFLIGEIGEIEKSGSDPFQKGTVRPFFSLRSTEIVFVITSWGL